MRRNIYFIWLILILSSIAMSSQASNAQSSKRAMKNKKQRYTSTRVSKVSQRARINKNAKRSVQKNKKYKKSPFILSFQEMRKLSYKKRVIYLRKLAKQMVIMEEALAPKKKARKNASFFDSGLDFLSWALNEARADAQYQCIGGGVPIEVTAESCGANEYAGFSCPAGQEICNPFVFGVQDVTSQERQAHDEVREQADGNRYFRAVCFDNATTRICYDSVRVGRESSGNLVGTVLSPVVNNLERYQEYEQMISTLTQMCGYAGRGMTTERATDPGAFNRACQKVKDQTAVNRRRDLLDSARLVGRSEEERRDSEFYEISVGEGHCLYANTFDVGANRYNRTDQCIEDGSVVIQNGPARPGGWVPVLVNGEQRYILSETPSGTTYAQTTNRLPTLSVVEDQHRQIELDWDAFSAEEIAAMSPQNRFFAEEFNRMMREGLPDRLDCRRNRDGRRTSGRWVQTSHCMLCNCANEASRSGISVNPEHDRNDSHRYSTLMVTLRRVLSPAFPLHGNCNGFRRSNGTWVPGSDGACINDNNPSSRVCSVVVDRSQFSWANRGDSNLNTPTLGYSSSNRTNTTQRSIIRNCYKNSLYSLRETALGRNYFPTNYARDYLHGRRSWTTSANRVRVPGEDGLKIGLHYFYQPSLGSTYHSGYAMQRLDQ